MQKMKNGKFIVLDGVDGSGKGTQAKLLVNYFFDRDKRNHVLFTREPYNSRHYRQIRKILKESENPKDNAERLAELFIKDRKIHAKIIKQFLNQGIFVISDRYKYSTIAYQSAQGMSLKKLIALHKNILVPDLVLIIDIPVKTALKRIVNDTGRKYKEVFEEAAFQEKLRNNYLDFPKRLPEEKIVIIDGRGTVDEVFGRVRKEADKFLAA